LFNNLNVPLPFLNINPDSLMQSIKITLPINWNRDIKGCIVPQRVRLGQSGEDMSWFEKPGIEKNRPMGSDCLEKSFRYCYDPTLITEPKTFDIQNITTTTGQKS